MLDRDKRIAVLELAKQDHSIRFIARHVRISRQSVRKIIALGAQEAPELERSSRIEGYVDLVRGLYGYCKGNLVRVHQELPAAIERELANRRKCGEKGLPDEPPEISYQALTRFCRRMQIGVKPKKRAGSYHFGPGEEFQHDTSPHTVVIAGKKVAVECASIVLCYSRMKFVQIFPRFTRFWAKVFLTDAIRFFGGAAGLCIVDNTSVIRLRGVGAKAVITPEMEAFGKCFGFKFRCHELGHSDRKARVENPFHYIERNFYAGRTFSSFEDINKQAIEWCKRDSQIFKPSLRAKPIELYQLERLHLRPLPAHIPEPYQLVTPRVDAYGYVTHETNRYSVDDRHIGSRLELRAYKDKVLVFAGRTLVEEHDRCPDLARRKVTLPKHRHPGRSRRRPGEPLPEEAALVAQGGSLERMVQALKDHHGGRSRPHIQRLEKMFLDYPTEPLMGALEKALHFGLLDLRRVEGMVLRNIRGDYFRIPDPEERDHGDKQEEDTEHEEEPLAENGANKPRAPNEGTEVQEDPGNLGA